MVRSALVLLVAASAASVHGLFSVHDDLLAFPQYEVQFPLEPVSEAEASARLAQSPTSSSSAASPTSIDDEDGVDKAAESYEALWLDGRRYLCSVPVVKPPPALNATEKELSRAAEEKELARATTRGWELLSELEGDCLYFVSGWWSYSYCHNREVRQFHQKAPQGGAAIPWPPMEDPGTPSYVLGQVSPEKRAKAEKQKGEGRKGSAKGEGTELQATGELRFLVQKLGGGTTCDLTRKERKIEIQFHCNSAGSDRIGWIKEVSICCYLMVVYTPRLCDDVAFLPPREDRANGVQCREIMDPKSFEDFYRQKAKAEQADALEVLREAARVALGLAANEELGVGVAVGGKKAKVAGKKADGKKADGKKGGKKAEVGGEKVEGKKDKVVEKKKGDKKLEQIVFVEQGRLDDDDDINDEAPEEDGEEEVEWFLHQEL